MTARRLPRSPRGRALPASATDTLTWPPPLRGRSPLLCVAVLGWLGGGLLATAVAVVTEGPNDLAYGLTSTAAALLGLLLLPVVSRSTGHRRPRSTPPATYEPVQVPAQPDSDHDDRRAPALR